MLHSNVGRHEDELAFRRKLADSEYQQRQTLLVQKLQAKVLTYKRRCNELELRNQTLEQDVSRLKTSVRPSARFAFTFTTVLQLADFF